jgi:hypothetical protein
VGLAGEWYNWFVARYENDPGRPERWETEWWRLIDALLDHAPAEVREEPIRDLSGHETLRYARASDPFSRTEDTAHSFSLTEAYRSPTQHRPCSWIAS